LRVAYFDQIRDQLDPQQTLMRTLCPVGEFVDYAGKRLHVRSYLDRFLFSPAQAEMRVGALSGGEQSRVLLALLMLKPANVLVLDEPTNDLDLATLSVLEGCLDEFDGAVLLVTHDRYFLDQISDQVLAPVGDGNWLYFEGLAQWEKWRTENKKPKPKSKPDAEPSGAATPSNAPTKKTRLSYKEQREWDGIEAAIQAAEERLAQLAQESERPENTSNAVILARLGQDMAEAQAEVDRLYVRWEELSHKV
jgi:ATP-binding cassette subfamily F protein uup